MRGPERADFRPNRADFRPDWADSRPEKGDSRPERADFRPERVDFSSERADFRPERAWGGHARTSKQTKRRTKVLLYSTGLCPFQGLVELFSGLNKLI